MPTIEIRDARKTVEITTSGPVLWDEDERLLALYAQLRAWHEALPLASCVWETLAPLGGMAVYCLTATAQDGRVWKLKVGLRPGVDAPMYAFNTPEFFEEAEFSSQREMRVTLAGLARAYGVSRVEVVWS